MHKKYFSKEVT